MNERTTATAGGEFEQLQASFEALKTDYEEMMGFQQLMCLTFDKVQADLNGAQVRVWMLATLLNAVLEAAHVKPGRPDDSLERMRACAHLIVHWQILPDMCLEELPPRVRTAAEEHAASEGFVVPPPSWKVAG